MSNNKGICFVIMPFSKTTDEHTKEYWTRHFEKFLKPLIKDSFELEVYRSEPLRGDILKQIITNLITAPIVIADLTDHNPNVFWELGVRQSFKHGTITIIEAESKLPFDVAMKGTLKYYPKDHVKNEEFRRRLIKAIDDCIKHPQMPDSHVLEAISGRGTLFEILQKDETIRRLNALISEIKHNLQTLKSSKDDAGETIKTPKEAGIPTCRFRTNCVELLIATRYVDEDENFFKIAESYHTEIISVDSQLRIWDTDQEGVSLWMVAHFDRHLASIKSFYKSAKATIEKIAKLH